MTTDQKVSKAIQEIDTAEAAYRKVPASSPATLKAAHVLHDALRRHWPTLRAALTAPPQPLPEAREVARYDVTSDMAMPRDDGAWCRWSDVQAALSTLAAQKAEAERETRSFRLQVRVLKETGTNQPLADDIERWRRECDAALKELERVRAIVRRMLSHGERCNWFCTDDDRSLATDALAPLRRGFPPYNRAEFDDAHAASILTQPKENA